VPKSGVWHLAGMEHGQHDDRHPEHPHRDGPTGLLIIRAWIEHGSSDPLRAHIRLSTDTSTGIDRELTLTQVDAVCDTVQEWLTKMNNPERPD
jgi:hypothetical protein